MQRAPLLGVLLTAGVVVLARSTWFESRALGAPPVAASAPAAAALVLSVRVRPLSARARLHIVAPAPDADLSERELASTPLRIAFDDPAREAGAIEVALDGARARRFAPDALPARLVELLAPDAELGRGAHWLYAAPVLHDGSVPRDVGGAGAKSVVSAQRFFVASALHPPLPELLVWCREPSGTYNGADAAHVPLDVRVLAPAGGVRPLHGSLELEGEPGAPQGIALFAQYSLEHPSDGDHTLLVRVAGAAPARTVFTVNRALGAHAGRPRAEEPSPP